MAKEIQSGSVVVLPVVGDCEIPPALRDKLYADFREDNDFEPQCQRLLQSMGVNFTRQPLKGGLSVEWTAEGPRVIGRNAALSVTEASALLDRYFESFPRFLVQEKKKRGEKDKSVWGAANVAASMQAGYVTYNRMPDERELAELKTELSQKYELFFALIGALHYEPFTQRTKTASQSKAERKTASRGF